ncbi:facilitated trehalose transporter Tret1-like [Chrysoperla carnea]|uniref:facilitated trehalose transporter Tret1-like n=1 Tax=Chrysoperla carnea TaxID=189513 RepID=UPI001D061906|nr:facilitated trehalose transporter Tret1-like [Chrysoperla carnea]
MAEKNSTCLTPRWRQYAAVIISTFAMFASGMHYSWTSPSLPKLFSNDSTIRINTEQGSWLASISLLGDLIGAPVGAFIADYLGRKEAVFFSVTPYLIGWILIAVAESYPILLLARFVVGIGDGSSYTILPMYIGEISDNDIRGRLGNFIQVMADFGALCLYSIGPFVSIKTMAVISSVIPILIYIVFPWFPESPYHLLIHGDYDKARKVLQKFRGRMEVDNELKEMNKIVVKQSAMSSSWKELFVTRSNLKALLILMGLKTIQQFSGISVVLVYTELIFESATHNGLSPSISAIIVGAVQLVFSFFSAVVVDYVGRKPLLIASSLGCAICLGGQTLYFYFQNHPNIEYFQWLPITSMIGYIIMYSYGLGALPFMMPSELFPTNIKAKALCIMDVYLALAAFVVIKLYYPTAMMFGFYVPFAFFTFSCLISIFFIVFCVPETKGRSLDEIQEILKGKGIKGNQTAPCKC